LPSESRARQISPAAASRAAVRCAIYTRKSTDEGLDQVFNTLDAQRAGLFELVYRTGGIDIRSVRVWPPSVMRDSVYTVPSLPTAIEFT